MDDREIMGTTVELPSRGLPYGDRLPGGEVTVGPMSSQEEKVLAGSGPQNALRAMDMLLTRCVPSLAQAGIKAQELVTGDRFYLMMVIRAVTYGAEYDFQLTCPSCNQRFKHQCNLPDDFPVYQLAETWKEPVEIELPICKGVVGLRLLRGQDEHDVVSYSDRVFKNVDKRLAGDPVYTYRIAQHIEFIRSENGELRRGDKGASQKILDFVEHLHGRDTTAIRQAVADNDCGPNTEVATECPRCGQPIDTALQYSAEFFRPGGRRRSGTVLQPSPALAGGE